MTHRAMIVATHRDITCVRFHDGEWTPRQAMMWMITHGYREWLRTEAVDGTDTAYALAEGWKDNPKAYVVDGKTSDLSIICHHKPDSAGVQLIKV